MDSIAKAEQIRAIAISRFVGYYGRLGPSQMVQIDEAIRITLALS
jgi:mRNA-degrading endonuclease toxin of MazEF toxin-antitoxin module